MFESSLSVKGQVTIPKLVRNSLKLKPGDRVTFVTDGHQAILLPIRGDLLSLRGLLKAYAGRKALTKEALIAQAKHHVATRYHRHRQGPSA
jgi:AbrB family looped-hinge helix DNA binding protein